MKVRSGLVLAVGSLFFAGCAVVPQQPVPLNSAALSPSAKVGVVMTQLPGVNTSLPGAGCLLCLAAAEIANSSLTQHAKTLPHEGLADLDRKLVQALTERGVTATVIPERIVIDKMPKAKTSANGPAKDFTALGKKYGVDKLLVVELNGVGFVRTYQAYFPTSDPKAWVKGAGYIVDVASNAYDWYLPVEISKASAGGWDEPPQFPGLTNAYFQTLELALDTYLNPFREGVPAAAAAEPGAAAAPVAAPAAVAPTASSAPAN